MKIGDELVYINKNDYGNQCYTLNKHYVVYQVKDDFIPGCVCGWFKDDNEIPYYFRDDDQDKNWKYISLIELRKQKLIKLCFVKD